MKKLSKIIVLGVLSALAGITSNTEAATFDIFGKLTGDIRVGVPDNLVVDVTVNVIDDVASWTVDINSPLHPSAKLDEFYFNLANVATGDLAFGGFSPSGWAISSPGSATGAGAGGATFMFEALDPAGPPNAADVTNTVNLLFTTTLTTRDWALNDFIFAGLTSADAGSGQMGAHLQSLTKAGNCGTATCATDSGFVFGNYEEGGDNNGGGGTSVPEPTQLALLGVGLIAMGASRLRKTKV